MSSVSRVFSIVYIIQVILFARHSFLWMNIAYLFNHQREFHPVMSNITFLLQIVASDPSTNCLYLSWGCLSSEVSTEIILSSSIQVWKNECMCLFTDPSSLRIEQFNDCWKTNAKVITPTNHNWSRQHSEPLQSEFLAISCNLLC